MTPFRQRAARSETALRAEETRAIELGTTLDRLVFPFLHVRAKEVQANAAPIAQGLRPVHGEIETRRLVAADIVVKAVDPSGGEEPKRLCRIAMDLVALDAKVQTRVKNTQRRGISDRIVDLYTPIVDRAGKASRRVKDETECPCIRGFRVQCLVA